MKAAQFTRFGGPQVIEIVDAPVPLPDGGEVLIRVAASSMNSVDVAPREGRLGFVAGRSFPRGVGIDAFGIIESI